MISFWIICALLIALAILFIVLPLWRSKQKNNAVERNAANLEIFRDQIADEETAKKITLEREKCEAGRYQSYYDIRIEDLSIYHIILNSEKWGVDDLGAIVDTAINQMMPRKDQQ